MSISHVYDIINQSLQYAFNSEKSFNMITQNKIRAILAYALRTAALLCATGSLMQTFLAAIGFSEKYIYIHASLFQAVNVLTILLCSRFADSKNVLRRTALVQIPGGLLFLFYLPLCIAENVSLTAYIWLLTISVVQSIAFGLHTVCEYKVPYYIYRTEEYGHVLAICGVLSSIVSLGIGTLMSMLSIRYSYPTLMTAAFIISCNFLLLAGVLQFFQKSLLPTDNADTEKKPEEKIPLISVFRHKAFSHLFVGNLTRGFANGTTTILAASALSIGYDETMTSVMVSVQSAATLAACVLFGILSRHIHPRYVILGGSLCFLVLPLLLYQNQPVLFLVMYTVILFGRTLIDYAVPSALLYAVPVEIAGTYNAWRMILHNGGTLIATMAAGFIPLPVLFGITIVCQLISGFNFFFAKIMRKK